MIGSRLCVAAKNCGILATGLLGLVMAGSGLAVSQMKADQNLEFLRLELPDGKSWVLGAGGIGRPFLVKLLLVNRGQTTFNLWDPRDAEGSEAARIALTDGLGRRTVLAPAAPAARSGVPGALPVRANQVVAIELDLLRLIGTRSLAPGEYKIQGLYENHIGRSPFIQDL